MIFSFEYDATYEPAIPIVELELRYARPLPTVTIKAVVDSGADATIIPLRHLLQIKARKGRAAWLRGTTQHRIRVDRYWVWLRIGSLAPMYVFAVADKLGEEAILGRDVLNHLVVTLNGLASTVEISG